MTMRMAVVMEEIMVMVAKVTHMELDLINCQPIKVQIFHQWSVELSHRWVSIMILVIRRDLPKTTIQVVIIVKMRRIKTVKVVMP